MGKALRKLSQKVPPPPELKKIMAALRDKDDIHVAIMGVSIVEATLERLIISRLTIRAKATLDDLFQNRGPLSDFNSKILIAQVFGIVTGPLAKELHSMRLIRNAFAHAKMPISFQDQPVHREINALKLLESVRGSKVRFAPELDNKKSFLLAIEIVLIMMDEIAKATGTADEVIRDALEGKK